MRAMVLYNDNARVGVSLLVEPSPAFGKSVWGEIDSSMEDLIGDLKKVEEIESVISDFPNKFPNVIFKSGIIYTELDYSLEVSTVAEAPVNNPFGIQQTGYVINNPKKIEVKFKERETT